MVCKTVKVGRVNLRCLLPLYRTHPVIGQRYAIGQGRFDIVEAIAPTLFQDVRRTNEEDHRGYKAARGRQKAERAVG